MSTDTRLWLFPLVFFLFFPGQPFSPLSVPVRISLPVRLVFFCGFLPAEQLPAREVGWPQ